MLDICVLALVRASLTRQFRLSFSMPAAEKRSSVLADDPCTLSRISRNALIVLATTFADAFRAPLLRCHRVRQSTAMETGFFRLTRTEIGPKKGIAVLFLILIAVAIFSIIGAYEKPFWYDEIITVILCRLPSTPAIWKALDNAADANPPLFYLIIRLGHHIVRDDHLAYRLPSILGLLGAVVCIYAILYRRVEYLSALLGAAFVLCTPLADYALQARPYGLMVGFIAAAIFAWQRIDDSSAYMFVLCIALAAALSVHYYALLVWPAFALAEASVWMYHRRFRAGTWLALLLAATPLLIFARLLIHLRQYYGQNFWARPSLSQIFSSSSDLFNVSKYWGLSFTIAAIVVLLCCSFGPRVRSNSARPVESRMLNVPIEERVLTVALLSLPLIAIIAAKLSRGGMTTRYMLPTVLGGALAIGYLTRKVPNQVRALLLVVMFLNYALSSTAVIRFALKGAPLDARTAAAAQAQEILAGYHQGGMPIVISSGLQYLPAVFYAPAASRDGLYFLADPEAALTYAKTDTVDLTLLVLRQYFPLQVYDYREFALKHRDFILVSDGVERWDWWPSRLSHDGDALSLLSADRCARVYRVSLKSGMP